MITFAARKTTQSLMKKHFFTLLILASSFFLSSCATLFSGTTDYVRLNSTPEGATVYINGIEACKTPCDAIIGRSIGNTYAEFHLDGYKTKLIVLQKTFNPVSILNLTSPVGWAIDLATGAVMKYDRRPYNIELEKQNSILSDVKPEKILIDTEKKTVEIYTRSTLTDQ